jgi:alditol oxidase
MWNWARNYEFRAARVHHPRTVEEIREIVARSRKVRALGSRHSFHDIADCAGHDLISLRHLDRVLGMELDPARPTVTAEAGITYGQLCRYLQSTGYALRNLASLPHISVVGACSTATHGSGDEQQALATAVAAMKIVDAEGDVVELSRQRQGERFDGMVAALGALGVVVEVSLELVPAFEIEQHVYERLPFAAVRDRFDEITGSAYSVSLFTDWQDETFTQVWQKARPGASRLDLSELGGTPAVERRHPVQGGLAEPTLDPAAIDPESCTVQLGEPGLWHHRLPHFRMDAEPSTSGEELQSEYLLPRQHAVAAMETLFGLSRKIAPLILISEVRTIAADRLWLSPCYERPSVGIHFTWRKEPEAVAALLPVIEGALERFEPRPHWGKLFRIEPARLRELYPRLEEFRELLRAYDPDGKFRNGFVERCLFGA